MTSYGMVHRVALIQIDVLKERIASIIRLQRISELGTTLAATSNRNKLLVTANVVPSSLILVTLMMQAILYPSHRFLQESNRVISQKTAFYSE
jgi:hypothetical protein